MFPETTDFSRCVVRVRWERVNEYLGLSRSGQQIWRWIQNWIHLNYSLNQVIKQVNNQEAMDSRDVAKMIGKRHRDLMRDIRRYINVLEPSPILDSAKFRKLGIVNTRVIS